MELVQPIDALWRLASVPTRSIQPSDRKAIMNNPTERKGILYYPTFDAADNIANTLQADHPSVRVVEYETGFAVQYSVSGPYYPERCTPYLRTDIAEVCTTEVPRYGIAQDGYTHRSGAPTSRMIRLQGEKQWRRLMCWCFSNIGTCFVRIKGTPYIVNEYALPDEKTEVSGNTADSTS